jgi:hypothetical protein
MIWDMVIEFFALERTRTPISIFVPQSQSRFEAGECEDCGPPDNQESCPEALLHALAVRANTS